MIKIRCNLMEHMKRMQKKQKPKNERMKTMELRLDMTEEFEQQLRLMMGNLLAEAFDKAKQSQMKACQYMTGKEAAAYLNMSYPTLKRLEEDYGLKTIRVAGTNKKLFDKSTIDSFMKSLEY